MAASSALAHFAIESVIRGHHVYKQIWSPFVREELPLVREHNNPLTTIVNKDGVVVDRVPRELSKLFWTFLVSGGLIVCEVTGSRKKGKGLKIPWTYKLSETEEIVGKLHVSHFTLKLIFVLATAPPNADITA